MTKPLAACGFIVLVLLSLPSLIVSGWTVGLYGILEFFKAAGYIGKTFRLISESEVVTCVVGLVLLLVGLGLYGALSLALLVGRRRLGVVAGGLALMVQGYVAFWAAPIFVAAQAQIQDLPLGSYLIWSLLSMAIIVVMVGLCFRPASPTPPRCAS